MIACVHCSHEILTAEDACTWCGRWQNGHMPMCESHPTAPSVGLCVVCARPLCGTCAQRIDGRLYCEDATHRAFATEHVLVATFDSEFEADGMSVELRRAGIPSASFSFRDHVASWWFPLSPAVRLFVPASRADEARATLANANDLS
jgi:hypothetical protein